jgi:hypothetical protein
MTRLAAAVILGLVLVTAAKLTPGAQNPPKDNQPLKLPDWWKAGDPVPLEKTNCVRCHLTAGRELTTPVRDFARSVHDRAHLSCHDCHGGDIEHDATAHEAEHDFIGTKLSAHMAACATCHPSEAGTVRKSKHYWDLKKRINRDYPACVDCHGNHDIGRPPPDFALTTVCTDCHKQFARDFPQAAAVVAQNDRLWKVLRQVHAKNKDAAEPTPAAYVRELNSLRAATARLMHQAARATPQEAKALNDRVGKLCDNLEAWLRTHK